MPPAKTKSTSVELRPVRARDLPFLRQVYAGTRAEELAQVPWDDVQKSEFLRMQFDAQHEYYSEQFPDARFDVVLDRGRPVDARFDVVLDRGRPVGRLYVDRRADEIRVIDIAFLPESRGKGLGGAMMQALLDEAAAAARPVRIHVEKLNRALRLYRRLGFVEIEDQGVYLLMEWSPPASGGAS
jgi:ribosomal protein S18 acetylase RimI-like enzyme